ncbi:hypothetical protein HHI36_013345 [Cryptolaemus montrouzieri]|uniref:Uncharacterized protein n=1 Tax=Cryptolaemus montrouzieri TaxID=559131 RepID=A0ABD2NH62_9CUCU
MFDAIGLFNKVNNYVSSVGSKLGKVGGKVGDCLGTVEWSDLWSSPKYPLDKTISNLKEEVKILWNTIMNLIMGKTPEDTKDSSTTKRRRRHVLEEH